MTPMQTVMAAAAITVDSGTIVAIVVPVIVAAIGGFFGYRQAVKVATKNAETKSQEINSASFQALNVALSGEIERLRGDRAEDETRHALELARVTEQLDKVKIKCDRQETEYVALSAWARSVVTTLRHPAVTECLVLNHLIIPDPPEAIPHD